MANRTTAASDEGFPFKLLSLLLAGITIAHIAKGKKVDPLDGLGALLTILAFLADR